MNFTPSRPARRLVAKILLLSLLWPAATLSAPPSSSAVITAIQTTLRAEGTVVEFWIEGDRSQIVHFPLEAPPRFVLDLPGAESRLPSHRLGIGAPEISRIRVARHADKIRVVVDATTGSEGFRNARLVETERGVA
ncbi:MAG: AMIN domain-containing protein, partial [Myxococcales bacterium]|nr:AMIN domain-containing protein [Myxococcales bacterium]